MRKLLGTKCNKFAENTILSSIWGFLGPLPTYFLQFYQWQATFKRTISLFSNLNHNKRIFYPHTTPASLPLRLSLGHRQAHQSQWGTPGTVLTHTHCPPRNSCMESQPEPSLDSLQTPSLHMWNRMIHSEATAADWVPIWGASVFLPAPTVGTEHQQCVPARGDIHLQQLKTCLLNPTAAIANHGWGNWDKNWALWEPKLTLIQECLAFLPHHCCVWQGQSMHVIESFSSMSLRNQGYWRLRIMATITQQPHKWGRKSLFSPAWQGPTRDSTATWAWGKKGKDSAPREQRWRIVSQTPVFYVQQKLQSSREQGAGYIVQAVVGLLGFGK